MVGNIPTRAVSTLFCVPSELYVQESDIDWDWTELPSLHIGRVNEVVPEGQVSMVSPLHWDTWNQEYIYPDGSPGRVIKLQGNIAIDALRLPARMMIDTGCQVSIVFRKGLIEGKYLVKALQPVSILTASGSNLTGGQKGCYLSVVIPICDEATGSTRMVHCAPSWAYEAAIKGNDLIIGYPFLKTFRFIIDCSSDMLLRGDSPLDSSKSTKTSKPQASALRKMRGVQKDCTWEEAGDQGKHATCRSGSPDRIPQYGMSNSQQDIIFMSQYEPLKGATKKPILREGVKRMAKKPASSRPKPGSQNLKTTLDSIPREGNPPFVFGSNIEQAKDVANASLHGNAQHKTYCSFEHPRPDKSNSKMSVDVPSEMDMDTPKQTGKVKILQISGSYDSMLQYYCESCKRLCFDSDTDCCLYSTGLIPIKWVQNISEEVSGKPSAPAPREMPVQPCAPAHTPEVFTSTPSHLHDEQVPLVNDFADMCLNELKAHSDFSGRFVRKNTLAVLREVDPEFFLIEEKQLDSRTVQGRKVFRLNSIKCSKSCDMLTSSEHARSQRELHKSEFSFGQTLTSKILYVAKSHGIIPTVDAFASHTNNVLKKYWWKHTNAFSKDWQHEILWCNPPHSLIARVVNKILKEQCQGIIIVPYKPDELWFHALSRITNFWWDLPFDTLLYDVCGEPFKSSTRFRVIFFNAFMAMNRCDNDNVLKSMLQPLYT